uniref:C-type lectin domain-containing protein n=1 Tax=Anolis carolinensis TaxID=28377 RepID=G1KS57_ANOCA
MRMASWKGLYVNVEAHEHGIEEPRNHEPKSQPAGIKEQPEEDSLYEAVDPTTRLEVKQREPVPPTSSPARTPTCSRKVILLTGAALLAISMFLNVLLLTMGTVHYSKMGDTLEQVRNENKRLQETACTPLGRDWNAFQESYYFFSHTPGSWDVANQSCTSMGSHLLTINSAEEKDYVANVMKITSYWIGLTDQELEGDWKWVDGTKAEREKSYWHSSEPGGGKSENCAMVSHALWYDCPCKERYHWICKRRIRPMT